MTKYILTAQTLVRSTARIAAALILSLCFAELASAQGAVKQLSVELSAGRVALSSATGNENSSGASVEGSLFNETSSTIRVDVNLSSPLYLVNRGAGQSMIAVQVYLGDGAYENDGTRSFISLRPRSRSRVIFVAFCADFEKDNPSKSDPFSTGQLPPNLADVSAAIAKYSRAHPDTDFTVAAQVAVWLAQGVAPSTIRQKFPFTQADERLARTLLK